MNYCIKCVMPDTKPYLLFTDEGICNACTSHDNKNKISGEIDWKKREKIFKELVEKTKAKKAPHYDVVIPVSGGKDSIYQVHMAQKYGLRVLAVNVNYGIKTKIGRENLSVIPKMGASLIEFTPEYNLHKKLIKIGLEDFGDPDLTSHGLLYSYPHWVAIMYDIPLVLWGENSALEYGGDEECIKKMNLDRKWFLKYVMTKQITVDYLSKEYDIPLEKLKFYNLPDEIMKEKGITSTFLGVYFLWDSEEHLKIAKTYGFKSLDKPREGTFRSYVGIDEKINRIHQFMKVLKFGYGRATDHACEEIRNGRMSRDEAIEIIKKYDTQALSDYYVDDFCSFMGYTKDEFWNIMNKYCNKDICTINEDHSLTIKGHKEL